MRKVIPLFLWQIVFLSMFFSNDLSAKTRGDVLSDAYDYASFGWVVRGDNLLDVYTYYNDGSKEETPDGIDDRAQAHYNSKTRLWEYSSSGDISWWPYSVGQSVRGEAYAWGGRYSTSTFINKINSGNKWIAGKRPEDFLPSGYEGFVGLDCSGFVGSVHGFVYKIDTTTGIPLNAMKISTGDIKSGDILNRAGQHTILIENIGNDNISAVHAVVSSFSQGRKVYSVIRETIKAGYPGSDSVELYDKTYDNDFPYKPYTFFPRISCIKCANTETELVFGVKSKRELDLMQ